MTQPIPDPDVLSPSRQSLAEALKLSEEILRNLELNELTLTNIALKASRLARLLYDFGTQRLMEYEAGGYPIAPDGTIPYDAWLLAVLAGRKYQQKDAETRELKEYAYTESISELEEKVRLTESSIASAHDPDVHISSANPYQMIQPPWHGWGNQVERTMLRADINIATRRLATRRAFIYQYVLRKHYELKFSGIADDVFSRTRSRVDAAIGQTIPDAVQKLTSVYDGLRSENPEDWSNAVHSCRRVLQDLADAVFPPTDQQRTVLQSGEPRTVKLGKDQYINRIIAFIEDSSDSDRFKELVGSHLRYLGDRIDSIFEASQKGSHTTIVSREEAERYVVYTYLLVGDILSLVEGNGPSVELAAP